MKALVVIVVVVVVDIDVVVVVNVVFVVDDADVVFNVHSTPSLRQQALR